MHKKQRERLQWLYSKEIFSTGYEIKLDKEEIHYALSVLRVEKGETVHVANGLGAVATTVVLSADRKKGELLLDVKEVKEFKKSEKKRILAWAFAQAHHLDWGLEKLVELGIDEIWLFPGENSQKAEISNNYRLRIEKVMVSALRQSHNPFFPHVEIKDFLKEWVGDLKIPAYVADLGAKESLADVMDGASSSVVVFIGPESGWSLQERELFCRYGVEVVSLCPYVLRTETAALVAASYLIRK